mgnify:CR=1 FL=1
MAYKVKNAIIMAAGLSSRFAPLSYEKPKALITVKGEVLIERQIRQLHEAGIKDVAIVVGYKKEKFEYLKEKCQVELIENPEYATRNNNGSIYVARKRIGNTYVCSADNYFPKNPFESEVEDSYYSVLYANGETNEWCVKEGEGGRITSVKVGGRDSWYMMGHTFWAEPFSKRFLEILEAEYNKPETRNKLWEDVYIEHIEELSMKTRKYQPNEIYEFDSLDELREFDESYKTSSGSEILKKISDELQIKEEEIYHLVPAKDENGLVTGVKFEIQGKQFEYDYRLQKLIHGGKNDE